MIKTLIMANEKKTNTSWLDIPESLTKQVNTIMRQLPEGYIPSAVCLTTGEKSEYFSKMLFHELRASYGDFQAISIMHIDRFARTDFDHKGLGDFVRECTANGVQFIISDISLIAE